MIVSKTKNFFFVMLLAGGVLACTPPEELDGDALEPSLEWDDLMTEGRARPDGPARVSKASVRPADLSPLMRAAALGAMENAAPYAGGLLGTKGDAKYFVATTSIIPGYNRLYWVIVKLLSERYSCFMRAKLDVGNMTRFTCKDGRQVVFWKRQQGNHIEFLSRQFDGDGYEIKVIQKRIVRISSNRII